MHTLLQHEIIIRIKANQRMNQSFRKNMLMILRGSKAKRRPQLKLKLKHNQIRQFLLLLENLSIEFCNFLSKVLKRD